MDDIVLISHAALWLFAIFEGVVILALARQLGLVLIRTGPLGGPAVTDEGPANGSRVPEMEYVATNGEAVRFPDAAGRRTLLVFVSQSCAACADLIPAIRTLASAEKRTLAVVLATVGDAGLPEADLLHSLNKEGIPYIGLPQLAAEMNVRGFPHGVVMDAEGITRSKGIVNNIVQLESLLEQQPHSGERVQPDVRDADADHERSIDVAVRT